MSGREEFTPEPTPGAAAQLLPRHQASAAVADLYARAGWTVVVQDVVPGEHLGFFRDAVTTGPLYLVVLAPTAEAVAAREVGRPEDGYDGGWTVGLLDEELRARTPRRGLWPDTSDLTPEQAVDAVLGGLDEPRVAG